MVCAISNDLNATPQDPSTSGGAASLVSRKHCHSHSMGAAVIRILLLPAPRTMPQLPGTIPTKYTCTLPLGTHESSGGH